MKYNKALCKEQNILSVHTYVQAHKHERDCVNNHLSYDLFLASFTNNKYELSMYFFTLCVYNMSVASI